MGWGAAADYALMLGHHLDLDNPVWTLDYEMRLSLLLPLLPMPVRRWGLHAALALAASLMVGGGLLRDSGGSFAAVAANMGVYGGMFVLGAALGLKAVWLQQRSGDWLPF